MTAPPDANSDQPLHYGNIFEYLSLWSEVQFLNIQKSKKIQEIQKPNLFGLHSRDLPENLKNVDFKLWTQGNSVKNFSVSYTVCKL